MPATVQRLTHPLAASFLTDVRDRRSGRELIRKRVRALAVLLATEATRDLALRPVTVRTPLAQAQGARLAVRVGLVPILRAGLGMVDGVLELLPDAPVFHLGLFRDEKTLEAIEYYNKLHRHSPVDVALVLDPMLATGGSAGAAVTCLKRWGVKRVKFLGLFAAPAGVRRLRREHPDVEIHIGVVDRHLNDRGYIVPGCGDAGDRQFSG
jgi:uracil phosphoribosyltransferase